MKKMFVLILAVVIGIAFAGVTFAADEKAPVKAADKPAVAAEKKDAAPADKAMDKKDEKAEKKVEKKHHKKKAKKEEAKEEKKDEAKPAEAPAPAPMKK